MNAAFTVIVRDFEVLGALEPLKTQKISVVWPKKLRRDSSFIVGVPPSTTPEEAAEELFACLRHLRIQTMSIARISLSPTTAEELRQFIQPIIEGERQLAKEIEKATSDLEKGKCPTPHKSYDSGRNSGQD